MKKQKNPFKKIRKEKLQTREKDCCENNGNVRKPAVFVGKIKLIFPILFFAIALVLAVYFMYFSNTTNETAGEQSEYGGLTVTTGSVVTTSWSYAYTGGVQTFTTPYKGTYSFYLYSAKYGFITDVTSSCTAPYATGKVSLAKGLTLYVVVGGQRWRTLQR